MKLERETMLSGRYSIRALLGEGGMGVVYRARDEQLGRYVAIKTIQGDRATDREFLRRFRREAIAISQIDHPHIVRLFEFVEAAGDQPPFMVMELLSGEDLGTIIRKNGPLDVTRAVTRTLEASVAIGECHRYGYLHRDVKPNNIFLHVYNQVETAKVLDFGAVKQDDTRPGQVDDSAELTRKGTLLGTPYYMPPEQIAGKPATVKCDQYSLGVVLYSALAGRKPFEVKGNFKDFELLQAITKGEYTPVQELRPEVPVGVADAVHKAMSVDPDERFLDLHSFGAAIRPYASQQARLIWEAHFTSSAPMRRDVHLSIAISASEGNPALVGSPFADKPNIAPTFARSDGASGTDPTAPAKYGAATTSQQADSTSRSFSLEIHETSAVSPAPVPVPSVEATSRSLLRHRPLALVGCSIVALAAALVTSFLLTHRKYPAPLLGSPPADLFKPPVGATPALAPIASPQAAAPLQLPSRPPSTKSAGQEPRAGKSTARTAPVEVRRTYRSRRKAPRAPLDSHGIPIPTN